MSPGSCKADSERFANAASSSSDQGYFPIKLHSRWGSELPVVALPSRPSSLKRMRSILRPCPNFRIRSQSSRVVNLHMGEVGNFPARLGLRPTLSMPDRHDPQQAQRFGNLKQFSQFGFHFFTNRNPNGAEIH